MCQEKYALSRAACVALSLALSACGGKLMIRKLRADWVARQMAGAHADARQYWQPFQGR